MKIKFLIFSLLFLIIRFSNAASSSNFYIDNTRVLFQNTSEPAIINVYNVSDDKIVIQSKLKMLLQDTVNNQLIEVNPEPMSNPRLAIVPHVLNINSKTNQPIRILALTQLDTAETSYRLFIKNISQKGVTSSGTVLQLGFSVPIYILPKKINEAFSFEVKHVGDNSYTLQIKNQGNVHIYVNTITLFDDAHKEITTIKTPGVILGGKNAKFNFSMDKKYASYKSFKNEIKMQGLVNYLDTITKTNIPNVNLSN